MKVSELREILKRLDSTMDIVIVNKDHVYKDLKYVQLYDAGKAVDGTYSVLFPEDYRNLEDKREFKKVLILA